MTRKQTTLAVLCPTWGAGRWASTTATACTGTGISRRRRRRSGTRPSGRHARAVRAPLVTAAVEQVRPAERVGVCIDCGSPTRPSSNWPAIAPVAPRPGSRATSHRCPRCYVRHQLDEAPGREGLSSYAVRHVRGLARASMAKGKCGSCVQPNARVATVRACPGVCRVFRSVGDVAQEGEPMMSNWHRDVARRKAREKLQRAQERCNARTSGRRCSRGDSPVARTSGRNRAFKAERLRDDGRVPRAATGRERASPRARAGRARTNASGTYVRGVCRDAGRGCRTPRNVANALTSASTPEDAARPASGRHARLKSGLHRRIGGECRPAVQDAARGRRT